LGLSRWTINGWDQKGSRPNLVIPDPI
jgi:hypothetical protein